MLVLPDVARRDGIPAGFGRALRSALVVVRPASESMSESESEPEMLETFPVKRFQPHHDNMPM